VRECPAAGTLPYVSLSCAGPLCDQLFKPCHADADWCVFLAMACPIVVSNSLSLSLSLSYFFFFIIIVSLCCSLSLFITPDVCTLQKVHNIPSC